MVGVPVLHVFASIELENKVNCGEAVLFVRVLDNIS